MLRFIVILLIAANGLYFAWSQGHLSALGWAPAHVNEPERVTSQIKPEALTVLSAKEAKRLESLAQKPVECLQSEVLSDAQTKALREQLQAAGSTWPQGSWSLESFKEAGTFAIFMGPYPLDAALDKKKQELKRLSVPFQAMQTKALGRGLSLAVSSDKVDLEKQLAALNKQGVRTAKIVAARPEASGTVLKLPRVTDELRPMADTLSKDLPTIEGTALRKCPAP
jgi:hypothetical protein